MEFPRFVFKDGGGEHSRHGGTYSTLLVQNEEEYEAALVNGWHATLAEVIKPVVVTPSDLCPIDQSTPPPSLSLLNKVKKSRPT